MAIRRQLVRVTATGSAGSASGVGRTDVTVTGKILAIHLDYHSAAPASTDVTVETVGGPPLTILDRANANTDGWFYPRRPVQDYQGNDLTYDGTRKIHEPFVVSDQLKVTVGGSNALDPCLTAQIYWET